MATLESFFAWAAARLLIRDNPTMGLDRRKDRRTRRQATVQRAIDYRDLERFWTDRKVPLRLKTLTRMLYETGARASELLETWTSKTSTWPSARLPSPARAATPIGSTGRRAPPGSSPGS